MIFETMIRCPTEDRYQQHLHLVRILSPLSDDPDKRRWLWRCLGNDMVMVRSARPLGDFEWKTVDVPEIGMVRFILEAHIRQFVPHHTTGRMVRVSSTNVPFRIQWLDSVAAKCGFEVIAADVRDAQARIGRWKPRPFPLGISVFTGVLRVTNCVALEYSMLQGFGNAKAYGFGYMVIAPLGGQDGRQSATSVRVSQSETAHSIRGFATGSKGHPAVRDHRRRA